MLAGVCLVLLSSKPYSKVIPVAFARPWRARQEVGMSDIATMIEHDVRQRMRREGLDPVTAPTQVRALVAQALEE